MLSDRRRTTVVLAAALEWGDEADGFAPPSLYRDLTLTAIVQPEAPPSITTAASTSFK